ncbi:daxx-like protein [Phymastichus coffea]|uniref:daxx-like protein n=1 Tax=Phymastichus coffea TaxID=108790 RepID=UPI00273B40F0|nr:daxx-like protein [Phymastichus coffea]
MRFLQLILILSIAALAVLADDEAKKKTSRDKREPQQLLFTPRRTGPPPYAVQMEPIAQYSQRDPLYNLAAKSDEQPIFYEESPYNYYPTEPEPIIEIIIKESNESLPTPVPPTLPPVSKKKKEPIQVFYVKYEKKQEYGEDKPRVVYDTPIPAINPVEEHEEIRPDDAEPEAAPYPVETITQPPDLSTTLRAIIKPDSEYYHSGSSGIKVTFGTEQIPPNNHNKRSDKDDSDDSIVEKPTAHPPPGSPKRPHGPYAQFQPVPPRVTPAFGHQRIVNSFTQQQLLGTQPPPSNFAPQFHQRLNQPPISFPPNRPPHQRLPITIQGLPDLQQRLQFNSFVPPHRISVNHPGSVSTLSHQNVQLQNYQQLPNQQQANFNNFDPFKQQREQEKQKYFEQQRLQDYKRQQEQFRILEQRRKQEQEQKLRLQQQQQQQQRQQHPPFKFLPPQQSQQQLPLLQTHQQLPQKDNGGEILKAIPKLEQHYAIRENPQFPGPFPPNPQFAEATFNNNQFNVPAQQPNINQLQPQQQQGLKLNINQYNRPVQQQSNLAQQSQLSYQPNVQSNLIQQSQLSFQQTQPPSHLLQQKLPLQQKPTVTINTPKPQVQIFKNQQSFFLQNLPPPQQQSPNPQYQQQDPQLQQQSIWGRPVFHQANNVDSNQKIFATPLTKTAGEDFKKISASTPNSIRYSSTPKPTTLTTPARAVLTTTTPEPTTTLSPKQQSKIKENIANLPDEVPDDIREQLLSSGILGNADIQILDYDKVGGINIGDLPPEALANFYGAGGAAATSASEPVPQVVAKKPKIVEDEVQVAASSSHLGKNSFEEVTLRPGGVEMKVVRFDPSTTQGQSVADRHIKENATQLNPVALGDDESGQYNRYLPLKVSGASFPIPSVPELAGKTISSVVVLAPVDYGFQPDGQDARHNRKIANDVQAIKFLAGESLKQLVKKPSADNYKRWLDQERQTEPQRQSVVLLVTTPSNSPDAEKEIFMYDVSSETVNKLAGNLSTAFVDAAESNADVNEDPMADVISQ